MPETVVPTSLASGATSVQVWPPEESSPGARVALVGLCDLALRGLEAVLSNHRRSVLVVDAAPDECARVDLLLHAGVSPRQLEAWHAHHPDARVVLCRWGPIDAVPGEVSLDLTLPADHIVARLVTLHHGAEGPSPAGGVAVAATGRAGAVVTPGAGLVGRVGLGPREAQVLALVGQGMSNAEITAAMCVSINTVKTYIRTSYRKIGVSSRTQAALWVVAARSESHRDDRSG